MNRQTITIDGQEYYLVPVNKKPFVLEKTFKFEVYPHDLSEPMTWVETDRYIKKHHPDWRMPTREELLLIYERKDEIGGFCTDHPSSDFSYPNFYWSCTAHRDNPDLAWDADFSDGNVDWSHKDGSRLSCRLVRLVPVSAAS